ncbi:MAG: isoaspartyl peptidase [Herminiimonas sp.]|nr:isoaspartyl peptidase [Herminiimonas sp.]
MRRPSSGLALRPLAEFADESLTAGSHGGLSQVEHHAQCRLALLIVPMEESDFIESERAVKSPCRHIAGTQFELNNSNAGSDRRLSQPFKHLPADSAPLKWRPHRKQRKMRRFIPEVHDRKPNDFFIMTRAEHQGVAPAYLVFHPVARPGPAQPRLDYVARHFRDCPRVGGCGKLQDHLLRGHWKGVESIPVAVYAYFTTVRPLCLPTSEIYVTGSETMPETPDTPDRQRNTLVVHGGAGAITRKTMTPAVEAQYRIGLERALQAGYRILAAGGHSVDAVMAATMAFEDDFLFNAGKGSVFTHDGMIEMDAAIMDGRSGDAGAVAGVTTVKNPIVAARAVMDRSRHVLLIGDGADRFAALHNSEIVDQAYFFTRHRWDQLQKAREKERVRPDHDDRPASTSAPPSHDRQSDNKFGTVGAVALDCLGNLAAATSTGGLTNKLYGRVGDSAIIGAGTYADNATAAISGTGVGEYFMRALLAYDIAARMKYTKASLSDAVDQAIYCALESKGGEGGVIALDAGGNIKCSFNTKGMYRGYITNDGKPVVQLYKD